MNILLVGCGYLGTRVARRLRLVGHRVVVSSRSEAKARSLERELEVEAIVADLLDPASLRALPAVDSVVHCVGYDRSSGSSRHDVGVAGLRNLLHALPASVTRFVHTSSTSVYGPAGGETVDEETPAAPVTEGGRVGLEAELLVAANARRFDLGVVLRLSGLYGPGRIIRREALLRGEPIAAHPEGWLNLVHIDDAARAVCAALEPPGGRAEVRAVNVTDDQPGPRRRYYELAARLLSAPPPRFAPEPGPTGDHSDRRIANDRLKTWLLPTLLYPTIEDGLPAALAEERRGKGPGAEPVEPPRKAFQAPGAGSM